MSRLPGLALGLLVVLGAALALGVPVYGLVGTLRTGQDPLAGYVGAGEVLQIVGLGLVSLAVLAALMGLGALVAARRSRR